MRRCRQRTQRAALAALTSYDDDNVGKIVLTQFARYGGDVRSAAFDVLLSRENWTERLAGSIADGSIEDIPPNVADRLRRHANDGVRKRVAVKLGTVIRTSASEAKREIKRVREVLGEGTGNPYAGEAAFNVRCAACHKLFHKGGNIGPDLTPYQRGNLDTLLISVINPNAEIREGFEYVTLNTTDGRSLSGFLTDQDTQVVALRGMTGEDIRVERKHVQKLEPMGRSLMPEGLLQGLSDQELRDFFAYLRISQPITR